MTARLPTSLGVAVALASLAHFSATTQAQGVRAVLVDSVRVRPILQRLWDESVRTNQERVACIGGERREGVVRVTRAVDLTDALGTLVSSGSEGEPSFESDSASVTREGSLLSIEVCRPPDWFGTVHTHRIEDGVEYPKLSSGDRAVISLWHERWRRDSVFCVMFSRVAPPACEWRPGAHRG